MSFSSQALAIAQLVLFVSGCKVHERYSPGSKAV